MKQNRHSGDSMTALNCPVVNSSRRASIDRKTGTVYMSASTTHPGHQHWLGWQVEAYVSTEGKRHALVRTISALNRCPLRSLHLQTRGKGSCLPNNIRAFETGHWIITQFRPRRSVLWCQQTGESISQLFKYRPEASCAFTLKERINVDIQ